MAELTHGDVVFTPKPNQPPPPNTVGVIGWLRKNLFGGPFDSLMTIVGAGLIAYFAYSLFEYAILNAVWKADSYRECLDVTKGAGACWAGVDKWMNNYLYGRYPDAEQWRVNLGGIILAVWLAPFWFPKVKAKIAVGVSAVLTYPFLAGQLFLGGESSLFLQVMVSVALTLFVAVWLNVASCYAGYTSLRAVLIRVSGFGDKEERQQKYVVMGAFAIGFVLAFLFQANWNLPSVPTLNWGGLFLTLVISGIAISSALPAGVILALGRRSKMPVIRVFCTAFIELFRSVPLITILFMAVTMMPLFLPVEVNLDKLVLVIIAVCIFAAAYMAEIVRGGLQAINNGQYEAAQAMGLNYWKMMALIIMPQALKLMIPNIVGNFIGLLKDTTLVSIIGLYDILLMVRASGQDPKWLGMHTEPMLFAAAVFFVICFAMSKYSQHLERSIGGGYGRR